MYGRLVPVLAVVALAPLLVGAGGGDGPATTVPPSSTTTTTVPWLEAQHQAVTDARQTMWLNGQPAPAPPVRLEIDHVVLEEIDGAQLAVLLTCSVREKGLTFDIFGGIITTGDEATPSYVTDQQTEVLATVDGTWTYVTDSNAFARHWEGEAGCATD